MLHKNERCQPLLFRILMTFNHTINKVTLVVIRDAPIPLYYKPIRVFYLCTCRYRVPIPTLLRFGLHESAINLEADFILSSADYVKPIVQNNRRLSQAKNKQSFLVLTHKKAFKQTISSH